VDASAAAGEESLIDLPGASLACRILGSANREPVLLIPGLGMQLVDWPAALVEALLARYRVVLFDNRDSGLSSRFGPQFERDALARGRRLFAGAADPASYALTDMASDVVSLMDGLDLTACHLIGFSMGGMIAQIVAAAYPERTLSLVSLMSSGGEPWIDCTSAAREAMLRSMAGFTAREHAMADSVAAARLYGVRASTLDAEVLAYAAARSFDRAYLPGGVLRQALAMRASGASNLSRGHPGPDHGNPWSAGRLHRLSTRRTGRRPHSRRAPHPDRQGGPRCRRRRSESHHRRTSCFLRRSALASQQAAPA
jgi:pimeloyl-ACP methyl ester carboxylesterase